MLLVAYSQFMMGSALLWDIVEPTAFVIVIIMLWKIHKELKAIKELLKKLGEDDQ